MRYSICAAITFNRGRRTKQFSVTDGGTTLYFAMHTLRRWAAGESARGIRVERVPGGYMMYDDGQWGIGLTLADLDLLRQEILGGGLSAAVRRTADLYLASGASHAARLAHAGHCAFPDLIRCWREMGLATVPARVRVPAARC